MKTKTLNHIGKLYSWIAIVIGLYSVLVWELDVASTMGMCTAYAIFLFHLYDGHSKWYTFIQVFAIFKIIMVILRLETLWDVVDMAGLSIIAWHAYNKQRNIK